MDGLWVLWLPDGGFLTDSDPCSLLAQLADVQWGKVSGVEEMKRLLVRRARVMGVEIAVGLDCGDLLEALNAADALRVERVVTGGPEKDF